MPKYFEAPPDATGFGESIRKYGYDFSSALADIIDNSITAKSSVIEILYLPNTDYLYIKDDGFGMSEKTLHKAMVLGGGDPLAKRDPDDLGRFGCGLKTASFSQAKKLTVITKSKNKYSGAQWDLDHIRATRSWQLGMLSKNEIKKYLKNFSNIDSLSGTIVIWENIDQIKGHGKDKTSDQNTKINSAMNHLRLTFHRFMEKEFNRKQVSIIFNGNELIPLDPFLTDHSTPTPIQKIPVTNNGLKEKITLQGFTLPALNKLTKTQLTEIRLKNDLNQAQGFYIYRGNRLIRYGGWLGLKKYQALTNLSRVKVDVPNCLDNEWNTDIKKTQMDPPPIVKNQMKSLLQKFHNPSKKIYKKRASDHLDKIEMWERYEKQEDIEKEEIRVTYSINKKSSKFKLLSEDLKKNQKKAFDELIKKIEDDLPFRQISIDVNDNKIE